MKLLLDILVVSISFPSVLGLTRLQADQELDSIVEKVVAAKGNLQGTVDDGVFKQLYNNYKKSYGGTTKLSSAIDPLRSETDFTSNVKKIIAHNVKYKNNQTTYFMGYSGLTDLSPDNVLKHFTGLTNKSEHEANEKYKSGSFEDFIESVKYSKITKPKLQGQDIDWSGYFGPVEFQNPCDTCYVFSGLGAIECQYAMKYGRKISLSKLQIMDCTHRGVGGGCKNGGNPVDVIKDAMETGVTTSDQYPYNPNPTGRNSCKRFQPVVYAAQVYELRKRDWEQFKSALRYGAITSVIDGGGDFQNYRGGVYTGETCLAPNHAVVTVGYGYENNSPYIKIRNSWDTTWGEGGYGRIAVTGDTVDKCGILSDSAVAQIY